MAHINWLAGDRRSTLGTLAVVVAVLLSGWFLFDTLARQGSAPGASPTPTAGAQPTARGQPTDSFAPTATPTSPDPSPTAPTSPTPSPTPLPLGPVDMPFVPVVSFWSGETGIGSDQLRAALTGDSGRYPRAIVPADDADVIAGALGITLAGRGERLSGVRDWPLRATVEDVGVPDQARTWTLVAGGDVMLDRGVGRQIFTAGRGPDYPWGGGTARVTRIVCCSSFDWPIPRTERTGNAGAVRELLAGGDIAMANLETAVRDDASPNVGGLTFVSHPTTVEAAARAGFDFFSLANNHIGNGREQGILTAIEVLDELGVAHAGAGRTAAEALAPAYFDVNGTRVAIFGCDWIAPRYWVRDDRVGSQSCRGESLVEGIRDVAPTVDVVIVFPHWGREYRAEPRNYQRELADQWTSAGADMVIGAHSHWASAIEEMHGKLIFYSLGNLVFDQNWSAQTQMGVILEVTFRGDVPVQAWLHPTVILDQAQPNLLHTDEDLRRVLDQMRDGSAGLLPY